MHYSAVVWRRHGLWQSYLTTAIAGAATDPGLTPLSWIGAKVATDLQRFEDDVAK